MVTVDRMSLNCVAHAVESHDTVSTPFSIEVGEVWAAISSPTISDHDASNSERASGEVHPIFVVRPSSTSEMPWGSRSSPNGTLDPSTR